jgi:hypothetical protein
MCVLAKIAERMLRAPKRRFGINHPLGAEQRTKPSRKRLGVHQPGERPMEAEFVIRMQFSKTIYELAPEHDSKDRDRQEKLWL